MKKIYLCFLVISSITYGQFSIDFDSFNVGAVNGQSPYINLWPGGTAGQVTTAQAFSGTKSMVIRNNGTDDVLFDLGNKTAGIWSIKFKVFIPAGKDAFWNIQNSSDVSTPVFNGQFFLGNPDQNPNPGGVGFDQDDIAAASFPTNQWFDVVKVIDLSALTFNVVINNVPFLVDHPYSHVESSALVPSDQIGAINFFSINTNNEFYVDNFELIEGNVLSTTAFENNSLFSVYPNPTSDYFQVKMNNNSDNTTFELVDLSGRIILKTNNERINLSDFNTGVYVLNVLENGQNIGSQKIIKK